MLQRCLRPRDFPSYIGCTIVPDWYNFQNFAAWYDDNYINGYELDKDTKVLGNRSYGPDTCLFISRANNTKAAHAKHFTVLFKGEELEVLNLAGFCRDNSLRYSGVHSAVSKRGSSIDVSKYVL